MDQIPINFEEPKRSTSAAVVPECFNNPVEHMRCFMCEFYLNCLADSGMSEEMKRRRDERNAEVSSKRA